MNKNRVVILAGLLAALILAGLVTGKAGAQTDGSFQDALRLYEQGHLLEAASRFEGMILDPALTESEKIDGLLLLAKCYRGAGDEIRARGAIERLYQMDSDYTLDLDRHQSIAALYLSVYGPSFKRSGEVSSVGLLAFKTSMVGGSVDGAAELGEIIADVLTENLLGSTSLDLVERREIDAILAEIDLTRQGLSDPATAARVGKLVGAQSMLMGRLMTVGGQCRISARLVVTETGEVVQADEVAWKGDVDDADALFAKLDELSQKVAAMLGEKIELQGASMPYTLDAARSYVQGIECLDAGDFACAAENLSQAAELAPDWTKPLAALDEVAPLVALDGDWAHPEVGER
jgi:TolB-like protein